MAIDNYENLGFQVNIDGADTVETHLGKIVKRLKQIQQLNKTLGNIGKSASKGIGGVSSTSSKLTEEERWDKQYQDKMRKQAYYLKQGYVQQRNIISDHTKWVLAEEKKLEKKRFLTEQGYIQKKPKLTEEEQFKNSFEKSKRRREFGIQEGYIQEKQSLSEIEKYLQRVNQEKDLLNSKTYEEARRIELANQQRKKEIDQRLKQELGIKQTTKSLTAYLAKLGSGVMIARRLGRVVSDTIQESANYVENLNLFAVAYGDVYQETLKWALDLADGFGLTSNEVLRFAGTFRQLSTSLGLVEDTANSVSKTVTQLGYDLSALFNTSVENAMEKLQSSLFSGNVRPLRAYGIDISQNQIDALFETNQALANLGVNARNLSQSDKVLARLIITLRDGSNAFGTMNREINTLQSQIRILQGSFSNFKLAIGDLVQEPIRQALIFVNAFVISLTNIIRMFKPLQKTDETVFNGVAMGAEEANSEIDKLNGKLADFDKFNVLGGQSQDTTSSAITEALTAELKKQQEQYEAVSQATKNQATSLAEYLTPALSGALIAVIGLSNKIPFLSKTLNLLKSPTAIILGSFVALYTTSDYFRESVNNLLTVLLKLVGNTLSPLVKTLQTLTPIVEKLLNVAGYVLGFFVNVLAKIVEFLDKTGLLEGAIWALVIAFTALKAIQVLKWATDVYRHFSLILGIFDAMVKANGGFIASIKDLGVALGKFLATQAKKFIAWLNTSKVSMGLLLLGVGVLVGGIIEFISSFDQLSTKAKIWIPIIAGLAGVITALAAGLTILKGNWVGAIGLGALVAGIGLSVGTQLSTSAHDDGGYTNANLIMTHENGKREWVGKAAGSSAIVNDTQMSDIMEVAVAKGVYNALSARSAMGGNVPTNETIVVKIGEEAVFNAVRKTARRQGRDFANV